MAHVYRGTNSREDRNPILNGMARCYAALVQEWYYLLLEMSSYINQCYGSARRCQGGRNIGPLILARTGIHKTKAGSSRLSQLYSSQACAGFWYSFTPDAT